MIGTKPDTVYDLPWEAEDGQGSAPDDALWNEQEMVTSAVSLQFVRVFTSPTVPIYIVLDGTPSVPLDNVRFGQALGAKPGALHTDYQDLSAGAAYGNATIGDIALVAPNIPTGGR